LAESGETREAIRLDQFLKLQGLAGTGGQAKRLIQDGQVTVNGEVDTRRGRKLRQGDVVAIDGQEFVVEYD
jgi:ribosome-associated protein